MTKSRTTRGRQTEQLLAEWLQGHGFPKAERRPASLPGTDILHTPGLAIEVKATTVAELPAFMRQASKNAAQGETPVVVFRPNGMGPERMGDWLVITTLRDFTDLYERAGYGE